MGDELGIYGAYRCLPDQMEGWSMMKLGVLERLGAHKCQPWSLHRPSV
jgi:hypothetical protein